MVRGGIPDSKVHGANMGPIWGRLGPGGPHVGPMNLAIWDALFLIVYISAVSKLYLQNGVVYCGGKTLIFSTFIVVGMTVTFFIIAYFEALRSIIKLKIQHIFLMFLTFRRWGFAWFIQWLVLLQLCPIIIAVTFSQNTSNNTLRQNRMANILLSTCW